MDVYKNNTAYVFLYADPLVNHQPIFSSEWMSSYEYYAVDLAADVIVSVNRKMA
jgi:hypothetical protein